MSNVAIQNETETAKAATQVLRFFADASQITFDGPLALRTVTEISRTITGSDHEVWGQRLVEAGESLNLRIRSADLTLDDVARLVRERIPVATCLANSEVSDESSVEWLVLAGYRRGKFQVINLNNGSFKWVRMRRVRALLDAHGDAAELRWITGQAAMPCDFPRLDTKRNASKRPIKPLERLLAIMQADRADIWSVVVFSVIVGILALATPIAVEALVNTVAFGKYLQPIVVLSAILLTFLGFAAGIRALITLMVEIIQRRLFVRVVEDLAYRFPRVEQEALDNYHGPELANRFFDVVTVQKTTAKLLLDGIAVLLTTILGMAVLAFYHPFLLGFDLVLLLCIGIIIFVLGRGAVRTAIRESESKYKVAAWLEELLRNPTAFKMHGGAQFGLDRADSLAVEYLDARRAHFRIVMRQIVFSLTLQAVAATALLGLGGWLVIKGELTLGQLVAAELIVMNVVSSFAKIGKYVESVYDLLAGVDKLGKLFDLPIEPHDKLFHLEETTPAALKVTAVHQRIGAVQLHQGLSFELAPQDRLAITGPAGSGKSALLDLLTGTRHPSVGNVSLDRIDLRELRPDSLREHVSLARDTDVFHGTIEENVHLNRRQINASDVRETLEMVGLLDELMRFPEGLTTQVQTEGAPLSTSQTRRLMLARAIANRPRLLLLDGILDGLSDDELRRIMPKISAKNAPWTLVLVTGKQSLADQCDYRLQLPGGTMEAT